MPPKLVIFDNDGVLVDSETVSNRIFAELITEHGLPTTFQESVERYMGKRSSDCVTEIEAVLGRSLPEDFLTVYESRCETALRSELVVCGGVPELLETLRDSNVPFCIASSGTPSEIDLRLVTTGLATRFSDNVYSGSMVARGKPAPDVFLYAAQQMGTDPSDCVVIEDSATGVIGAKAAGATVIGHANLLPPARLREAGADHVVTTMHEIAPLLGL